MVFSCFTCGDNCHCDCKWEARWKYNQITQAIILNAHRIPCIHIYTRAALKQRTLFEYFYLNCCCLFQPSSNKNKCVEWCLKSNNKIGRLFGSIPLHSDLIDYKFIIIFIVTLYSAYYVSTYKNVLPNSKNKINVYFISYFY